MFDKIQFEKPVRISKPAKHAAFTDLHDNPFDDSHKTLFCCYREAQDHVSPDGRIRILTLDKTTFNVIRHTRLSLPKYDLRDPKFSFDGRRLILTAYAKTFLEDGTMFTKMVSFFSTTGESWSSRNEFGESRWWLWNHTWYKDEAYGFAYNRPSEFISLFKGDPTRSMQAYRPNLFGKKKQGKGYPNESAFLIDDAGTASVFLRRDADTFSAQFGTAVAPYVNWQWYDLGIYIGGPAAVALKDGNFLVAGRHIDWQARKFSTRLWHFNADTKTLRELVTLPSAGDTSYPGLVLEGDTLYCSYYSCHIDKEARVYMIKITGVNTLYS